MNCNSSSFAQGAHTPAKCSKGFDLLAFLLYRLFQFLRLCHLEPNYSYEVLEPCSSNYPRPGTECNLKVGRRHILLEFKDEGAEDGVSVSDVMFLWF